jgi:hypothetical protein
MIRAPLRPCQIDTAVITPTTALDYELAGKWPVPGERLRFWNGRGIPDHLRHEPDPRKVLLGDDARLEYEAEFKAWQAERIRWLRERADG